MAAFQIDLALSSFVQASFQDAGTYLASQGAVPFVDVPKQTGKYHVFNSKGMIGSPENRVAMAANGGYNRTRLLGTTASFALEKYGHEILTPLDDIANADFSLLETDAMAAAEHVMNKMERDVQALLQTSTNFLAANRNTLTGTDQWSDDNSDPRNDCQTAIRAIRLSSFNSPGRLVARTNEAVLHRLQRHPLIRDQLKYTDGETPDAAKLARYLGLDELLVGLSVKDSAANGQDAVGAAIWTDSFSIVKVPTGRATPFQDCHSKLFRWQRDGVTGMQIQRYEEQATDMHITRARAWWDPVVTNSSAGYIIIDCLA